MSEFFSGFAYMSLFVSVAAFCFGSWLKQKTGKTICNPLMIAVILSMVYIVITDTGYESYSSGMTIMGTLLTPAMICFAIPLYKQLSVLKKNAAAIILATASGVATTFFFVTLSAVIFNLSHVQYVTMLPRSVTTAIGIVLVNQMEGIEAITVAAILVVGIIGNLTCTYFCKIMRITNPVAMGVAIGSSCHVLGTTRAMELGEVQGAMSSLATVISGLLTAFLVPLIANVI